MSNHPQAAPHALPDRPNLRHLKDQAKDLVKAGTATSITDAQFKIARLYGFPSWPKLKAHLESLEEAGQLKQAIDRNDIERVKTMMTRNPALHRAPLGYGKGWAAHMGCRVSRAVGATQSDQAGDGEVDDRKRLGRAPGRRWTADESGAQGQSHSDDGT
jgi:hypothetical protein